MLLLQAPRTSLVEEQVEGETTEQSVQQQSSTQRDLPFVRMRRKHNDDLWESIVGDTRVSAKAVTLVDVKFTPFQEWARNLYGCVAHVEGKMLPMDGSIPTPSREGACRAHFVGDCTSFSHLTAFATEKPGVEFDESDERTMEPLTDAKALFLDADGRFYATR